jgi:hypothetical protein
MHRCVIAVAVMAVAFWHRPLQNALRWVHLRGGPQREQDAGAARKRESNTVEGVERKMVSMLRMLSHRTVVRGNLCSVKPCRHHAPPPNGPFIVSYVCSA